jgi:hypothetical protein
MWQRFLTLGLCIAVLCGGLMLWSSFAPGPVSSISTEAGDTTKKKQMPAAIKKIPTYVPMFACKYKSGKINKQVVLDNIGNSFCVHNADTKENYKVLSFDMNYAELGYYEDSVGIPTLMTEYFFSECKGDTISSIWRNSYKERLHRGDTIKLSEFVFAIEGRTLKIKDNLNLVIE